MIENKEISLSVADLCYYPAGTAYLPLSSEDEPLYFVTLNFDFTREFEDREEVLCPVRDGLFDPSAAQHTEVGISQNVYEKAFVLNGMEWLCEDMMKICEEFESDGLCAEALASSHLQYLLLSISEYTARGKLRGLSGIVADYIEQNYKTIKSADDIGAALNYHPYYLNRVFRQKKGITLHRYIMETRLRRGASLLRLTDMSVAEISEEVGFENPNHFSKCFRDAYGVSPREYRGKSLLI